MLINENVCGGKSVFVLSILVHEVRIKMQTLYSNSVFMDLLHAALRLYVGCRMLKHRLAYSATANSA